MTRVNQPNPPVDATLRDVADLLADPPESTAAAMRAYSAGHPIDENDVPAAVRRREQGR